MAIRHFRKHIDSHDSNEDSLVEQMTDDMVQPETERPHVTATTSLNKRTNEDSSSEEEEEYSDSSESSDSDSEIILHRPVFLKKKEASSNVVKKPKTTSGDKLMERVDYENEAIAKKELLQSMVDSNYTTDKELLRKIMLLDDSDLVDPQLESKLWESRQEERLKTHREKLVAKQLELEEYEAKKLLNKDKSIDKKSNENKAFELKTSSKPKTEYRDTSDKRYRPGRVKDIEFSSKTIGNLQNEENEYSIF
ncbi:hypothetical protein KAFR_0G01380 [Kazachstania africana CBS 2517]|uniref:Micro-fibrillar-associated protein 1 C-terminal domain-containing protein n=1 Tax=Kazachstania africana (strain ATCC 22294 / BCRC 22015 / CBS 2517 / CECT 1963 / NBRC 1671 / NRRL Y-8276) TaxID=1071382 RepID=H2AXS2_KAZAF|nr:hypothetical protein KAFR_0G01380 [Kazachstania africana CBS 2517]CCF59172.1 hypothetical protein KAFR_0G01380 [Kazachstania africana CBS 2517]